MTASSGVLFAGPARVSSDSPATPPRLELSFRKLAQKRGMEFEDVAMGIFLGVSVRRRVPVVGGGPTPVLINGSSLSEVETPSTHPVNANL